MLGNHSHTIWTVVSDNTVWGQNMSTCEEKEDVTFKQNSFADHKNDNYIMGKMKREKERCSKRKFNWLAITDLIRKKDKRGKKKGVCNKVQWTGH